jgi:hypothetical protein
MPDDRGPITLITSMSDERNRWKALAYAWKGIALQAADSCGECGAPALWRNPDHRRGWCEVHWKDVPRDQADAAEKVPWYVGLLKAMDLEDEM